jgi:hypothetical protein
MTTSGGLLSRDRQPSAKKFSAKIFCQRLIVNDQMGWDRLMVFEKIAKHARLMAPRDLFNREALRPKRRD